jgi:FtsP/CotA-like multicopper oxidase with cupredoxin domain
MRLIAVAVLSIAFLSSFAGPAAARTRTYYIAADEVVWKLIPSGRDLATGHPIKRQTPARLGWTYKKAVYREYTDATFRTLKPRPAAEAYLGILGPAIRAEVGDTILVVFKNNAHHPYSIHPHGVFYLKASEGAPYNDGKTAAERLGNAVPPGRTYTYTWQVPRRAGPGPGDTNSIVWMYHSHTDEIRDVNTGLFGPIIITAAGQLAPSGIPKGVDREIVTAFVELEEDQSLYLSDNIRLHGQDPAKVKTQSGLFLIGNQFYTINGYLFGNMPMPVMRRGERVRWYVISTQSDFDLHSPHWHGQTVLENGKRTDTIELPIMGMEVVDMVPDNPGVWLYHCHINFHLQEGMSARFQVLP